MTFKPKIDNKLLYRRQYFIGPKFISRFNDWNKYKIGTETHITAHPDLEVTTAKNGAVELALLGFMFDSEDYKSTNQQILNNFISNSESFDDLVRLTYRCAGRWILIYTKNEECKFIHDPGGLRQLFYCKNGSDVWCSAQPHILANILDKKERTDNEFLATFNSIGFENNERALAGDETSFQDIYHLTPNHYLNYSDCTTHRYWPDKKIELLSVEEVAQQCSKIFTELQKAAKYRYKTANIITAGWDTRVLLAASRSNKDDNHYFVHKLPEMNDNHEDIYIPQELAKKNNFTFDVVDCTKYDTEFDKINSQNVNFIQSDRKKFQYYNYFSQFEGKIIISGNVSPLIKELFHPVDKVNPVNLARLLNYHNDKYAIKAITKWLKQAKEYSNKYNVAIEKLLYWEIRFGTWAAMFNAELDIATEEFSPFNCRDLIILGLSTPANYRTKPDEILYRNIIKILWPELLEIPINPVSFNIMKNRKKSTVRATLVKVLKSIGLYKFVRYFYRKLVLR